MKKTLKNIPITFLVSRGRSGSTLIQSILDAHPNICAPLESKFVLHLRTKYEKIDNWNENVINQFIKDLYTNRKFRLFWNITPKELRSKMNDYEINQFSDACKVVYLCHHSFFKKDEIKLIVDKNPLHSRFSDILLNIFPEAKFLHLIRDPRAVTYSHIKSLKQRNASNLAYEWRLLNERIEQVKLKYSHLFHTFKYEDFTLNPEKEARNIFSFINLPFFPEILDANKTLNKNYKSSTYLSLPQHKSITTPINNNKNKAWEDNLKNDEINLINIICEKQLKKYGYESDVTTEGIISQLIVLKAKWRSKFKNFILKHMFNLPFGIRALLYNSVSLIKDKQYKN